MNAKMKACWCGEETPKVKKNSLSGKFYGLCPTCLYDSPERDTRADAIAAWNKRAGRKP